VFRIAISQNICVRGSVFDPDSLSLDPDSLSLDPDSLSPDPDPAFLAENRSGSRVLITKSWKNLQLKNKFIFFCSKITINLYLGLHKQ
jgi:hypothetical protein